MTDGERLATVETEIKGLGREIGEIRAGVGRIEGKFDMYAEAFIPRKEHAETLAVRDARIMQSEKDIARVETEHDADIARLDTELHTEIKRLDGEINSVRSEQIQRDEDRRVTRQQNKPHWANVAVAVCSLGIATGAFIYAVVKG